MSPRRSREDERYRATDLNYHGPTVKGWRSAQDCQYPQDITLQLHVSAVIYRIQILAHQYLIPQKIEIWTCEEMEYDPAVSPSGQQCFQYLGFITLSDNQNTAFKSRELKSVTTPPTPARFVKLRLFNNHSNEKNIYNQVALVAVSVLGDARPFRDLYSDDLNNNGQFESLASSDANLISNPLYTSPYDDLAFEMYVDKDVVRIMRLLEQKKHQAVIEERFEYARKLKLSLQLLREAGETLGRYEQEKRQAINLEDYDKAKEKKLQIDKYRDKVYTSLRVEQLLELEGYVEENDLSAGSIRLKRSQDNSPDEADDDSFESPEELEIETKSPHHRTNIDSKSPRHSLRVEEQLSPPHKEQHVTWSPQHLSQQERHHRRTSLSDFPIARSTAPSPNPLSHSFSHSSFPTSYSTQHLRQTYCETPQPQFQCYTPYTSNKPMVCPQLTSLESMYQSLPPMRLQDSFCYGTDPDTMSISHLDHLPDLPVDRPKTPLLITSQSPPQSITNAINNNLPKAVSNKGSLRRPSKSNGPNSYEAYEERMLPALRHPPLPPTELVRECQHNAEQVKKSKLNEREKKQAALPISVFGMELVEKFYSKHFADKEEGLKLLQEAMKTHIKEKATETSQGPSLNTSPNKIARASIFLLHRGLRDKVYSVYSAAADAIRMFFHDFVPNRVSTVEVARSVEKLLPELIAKSGDVTPRIHNMAAHTLLSMVDCKQVRDLHIIPASLSRPLSSSVHPRLALSRLEMVEQLILNHGFSSEKQSGLTCRTLAEFGSSGLHHPAEAVRKVSERILIQVYKVNPRIVRKQLPPDDDVTRRNLLYRQLFQEFDYMDNQRRKEQQANESANQPPVKPSNLPLPTKYSKNNLHWNANTKESGDCNGNPADQQERVSQQIPSQIPKRTVNQQTSPMTPVMMKEFEVKANEAKDNKYRIMAPSKQSALPVEPKKSGGIQMNSLQRRGGNMTRISEEINEIENAPVKEETLSKFSNLVDSVHVAENRLSFAQKVHNLKSLQYIFPTSYIGTSSKSQESVDKSNSLIGFPKGGEGKPGKSKNMSGIPVPRNGFSSKHKLGAVRIAQKLMKPKNSDMTTSVYIPNDTAERDPSKFVPSETTSSSASVITPPSDNEGMPSEAEEKEGQTYRTCIFCLAKEDWFNEESLNVHYWKTCPMLTRCSKCKEVVEIAGLIQHRLDDCEYRKDFKKCDRCQEAILAEDWDTHECRCCKIGHGKLRCPYCHDDLQSDTEWKHHLMGENSCPRHPRKSQ